MAAAISPCETPPGDIAQRRARAVEVERQLCELAAHTHAAMAELSRLAADLNDLEGWVGEGIRSFSHWVALNAGFAPRTGEELLRVSGKPSALCPTSMPPSPPAGCPSTVSAS